MPNYIVFTRNKKTFLKRFRPSMVEKTDIELVMTITANTKQKAINQYKKIEDARKQAALVDVISSTSKSTETKTEGVK